LTKGLHMENELPPIVLTTPEFWDRVEQWGSREAVEKVIDRHVAGELPLEREQARSVGGVTMPAPYVMALGEGKDLLWLLLLAEGYPGEAIELLYMGPRDDRSRREVAEIIHSRRQKRLSARWFVPAGSEVEASGPYEFVDRHGNPCTLEERERERGNALAPIDPERARARVRGVTITADYRGVIGPGSPEPAAVVIQWGLRRWRIFASLDEVRGLSEDVRREIDAPTWERFSADPAAAIDAIVARYEQHGYDIEGSRVDPAHVDPRHHRV
jgi:hypothetical protein